MRPARSLLLAVFLASTAQGNPSADVSDSATVYYSQTESTFAVGGVARDFKLKRAALDYSEAASSWLYSGISVGMTFIGAETEPLVASSDLPGYHFGVFGGARFLELGGFSLLAEASYARDWASGGVSGDDVTVRLGEGGVRLGAVYRTDAFHLAAGAYTSNVVGDVDRTGATLAGAADVAGTQSSGGYGELALALDGGWTLGLRAQSGADRMVAITFSTGL